MDMIFNIKPRSEAIDCIGYENKVLTIKWKHQPDNQCYAYYDVPRKKFEGFTTCSSYQGYFEQEIKSQYRREIIQINGNIATPVDGRYLIEVE